MRNAALPGELPLEHLLASDAEGEHSAVEIELVLHVAFDRPQIEHQLIPARDGDAVLRRRDRRHIIGQLQSGARRRASAFPTSRRVDRNRGRR